MAKKKISARNRFFGVNNPSKTDEFFSTTAVFSVVIPLRPRYTSFRGTIKTPNFLLKESGCDKNNAINYLGT
jgi:hypothetical protein